MSDAGPCLKFSKEDVHETSGYSPSSLTERRSNIADRAKQDQSIISGRLKSSAPPEFGSLPVDGVDHQCPPTDQRRGLNAALKGVLHKASPDAQLGRANIGRELAKQHAGNWIRRLPRPHGARWHRWHNGCWCKAVISHHTPCLMHDENGGKTLLLIGERTGFQPVVERRLATGELRNIMGGGKRFGSRKLQGTTASPRSPAPTAQAVSALRPSPEQERLDATAHP